MTSEEIDTRRRRAIYRASHRGTKEMDWMLGRFAASAVPAMSTQALATFERFIMLPDPVLQETVLDPNAARGGEFAGIVAELRVFHGLDVTEQR